MKRVIDICDNWKFCEEDLEPRKPTDGWGGAKARAYFKGAASADFDDTAWRSVDLPHDFVSEKDYCFKASENSDMREIPEMESIGSRLFAGGCLEGGAAWYRKKITLTDDLDKKRVYIRFEGVYRDSTLYVNEYYVANRASGYGEFFYDITDFINPDGENIIAVRVDASEREGWWYEGGGIYRKVLLEITDEVRIAPWGLSVTAKPNLAAMSAEVTVETEILNKKFTDTKVTVISLVIDTEENAVWQKVTETEVGAWDKTVCRQFIKLDSVNLWSTENPHLYKLKTEITASGGESDAQTVIFGVRDFRFDADKGFFLNGEHIKIKGLCCHHDHAGVGIGMPEGVDEYRISEMKSMGANALRSSHYPASQSFLDACDRLGMLVFDETRRMSSAPEDIECLRTMVKSARNHPSVFLWGIGNEEIFSQNRPETERTTRTMIAEIRKLDKTRPVTSAVVCWDGTARYDNAQNYIHVTKNLDVMGFNYCPTAWDDYHTRVPSQPVIITEATSNSSTRGCYSTDESKGLYFALDDGNEKKCKSGGKAVKKDIGENMWKACDERDYLAGLFLWTGTDYRGEPTPLGYPAVYSSFGIFDYCAFKKDNYYYYKSWWQNEDVLHIFPHWNYPVEAGESMNVYCYSNFDSVELFVNGKSCGKKSMEKNWYITWENVIYEPGEAKAVGYRNGKKAAQDVVRTTGAPYALRVTPYKDTVSRGEAAVINVDVVDENGLVVPTADNVITFEVSGGKLLGTGNGDPADHESEKKPVRRAFCGKCQAIVKASDENLIEISAFSETVTGAKCEITVSFD